MTNQTKIRWFIDGEEIQPKPKHDLERSLIERESDFEPDPLPTPTTTEKRL